MPCFIVRPENMHIIPKPESSDLSCGLEFDEAVGLKRPNLQDLRLRDLRRLGLLSPTAVPKRCKRSELSGFGIKSHRSGRLIGQGNRLKGDGFRIPSR